MQTETKEKSAFKVLYILPEDLEPFREYAKANGRTMTQQFHVEVLKLSGTRSLQRRVAMQTHNANLGLNNHLGDETSNDTIRDENNSSR